MNHLKKRPLSFLNTLSFSLFFLFCGALQAQKEDFFRAPTTGGITVELQQPDSLAVRLSGNHLRAIFRNHTEEPIIIITPQDGSYYGWLPPYYHIKALDVTTPERTASSGPITPGPRCGNYGGSYDKKTMLIVPPKGELSMSLYHPLRISKAGTYRFQLLYIVKQGSYPGERWNDFGRNEKLGDWPKNVFVGELVSPTIDSFIPAFDKEILVDLIRELLDPQTPIEIQFEILGKLKTLKNGNEEEVTLLIKEALPVIVKLLQSGHSTDTIEILGELGECAGDTVPALLRFSHWSGTLKTLGQIGPKAEEAIPLLIEKLQSEEYQTANEAALIIGQIARRPEISVPALIECLSRRNYIENALWALGQFGKDASEAIPLIKEIAQKRPKLEELAEEVLIKINEEK